MVEIGIETGRRSDEDQVKDHAHVAAVAYLKYRDPHNVDITDVHFGEKMISTKQKYLWGAILRLWMAT